MPPSNSNLIILSLALLLSHASCILDRTYYNALELPVSATQQDVRDAFRRLSKKYHPDRNPDSGARARFEQINVAYQCLYNADKKYLYDRVGIEKMNDPNLHHEMDVNSMKGPQLKIKVFLDLKDFYLGKKLESMVEKQVACPHCHGTGAENPYDVVTCKECGGKGRTTRRVDIGGGYYNLFTQTCPRCQGKGKVIGRQCHLCRQAKIIPGIEEFELKVKPGTASNSLLRYTNMGDERMIGAPSDIVFELIQIEHPVFRRENEHLHAELPISLEEAILGYEKELTHLDGRKITLKEEGISQPGSTVVIQGEGMPNLEGVKGNLYVKIHVVIPDFTSAELDTLEDFFKAKAAASASH